MASGAGTNRTRSVSRNSRAADADTVPKSCQTAPPETEYCHRPPLALPSPVTATPLGSMPSGSDTVPSVNDRTVCPAGSVASSRTGTRLGPATAATGASLNGSITREMRRYRTVLNDPSDGSGSWTLNRTYRGRRSGRGDVFW